ncbi:MAG: putative rane protein [Polaromonas sp.]|nr:putative rane protein [Polaromonas sp.]
MNELPLPSGPVARLMALIDQSIGLFGLAELVLVAAFLLLAVAAPRLGSARFARIEALFAPLAHRPGRQIIAVGLLAVLARAAVLPLLGAPVATVHDEQSLLLQGQTYLAGRLANPPHPLWQHFESFHINQLPAYASMYFPGRGAPLAAGLWLAGEPWLGVWLSFVLMSMAAVWMLQAWVSLPMALLGGLLVVVRFGVFSYWINAYWGGAFTALGALLVFGALPRILRHPQWRHGVLLGLGLLILMTTRPYEGALACLPVAVLLLWRLMRRSEPALAGGRMALAKVAVPAAAFAGAGLALLLAYNAATTGQFLKTPYSLNRETYAVAPAFLISPPLQSAQRGPAYFRDFYNQEARAYLRRGTLKETVRSMLAKMLHSWNFYLGATFTAAFLAGLWAARRNYFLLGTLGFFYAGYCLETWNFPHYTAPLYPVILILMMRGFEWLRGFEWRGKPAGLFLTRAMPATAVALLALPTLALWLHKPWLEGNAQSRSCCMISDSNLRSRLAAELQASPGQDLVLVKDGPNNPLHFEMVYNEADIDHAEIVWARSLGGERDLALRHHFAGRRMWEFEWLADPAKIYRLTPLNPALTVNASARP